MGKGIFITATGTDVGKTYVCGLILKKLIESGENATYYKAALSGAIESEHELIAGDAKAVFEKAGLDLNPNDENLFAKYKMWCEKLEKCSKEYESKYGPLCYTKGNNYNSFKLL